VGYFLRPREVEVACVPRSPRRLIKRERVAVEWAVGECLERYLAVEEPLGLDRVGAFGWPDAPSGQVACVEQTESWAEAVRRGWYLGLEPIGNLCETLGDNGVKVVPLSDAARSPAFACCADGGQPVVAVHAGCEVTDDRQRFAVARELGRLVLARRLAAGVSVGNAYDRLAGALLVPRDSVTGEVGERRAELGYRELLSLKRKWGLGMLDWYRRLRDLGVISASHHRSVVHTFGSRGWYESEPGGPDRARETLPLRASRAPCRGGGRHRPVQGGRPAGQAVDRGAAGAVLAGGGVARPRSVTHRSTHPRSATAGPSPLR